MQRSASGRRSRSSIPCTSSPRDAVQRYGTALAYERALVVARKRPDGQYDLLASTRPATDNLAAPLGGAGVYLAAAPR